MGLSHVPHPVWFWPLAEKRNQNNGVEERNMTPYFWQRILSAPESPYIIPMVREIARLELMWMMAFKGKGEKKQ